jgi:hypothetical protein
MISHRLLPAVLTALVMSSACSQDDQRGSSAAGGGGTGGAGGWVSSGGTPSSSGTSGGAASGGGTTSGGTSSGGGSGAGAGSGSGGAAGLPTCPTFADGVELGKLQKTAINEASGIAESRKTPGVFFVHNDSGDGARVFAVGSDGKDLGTFVLGGAGAIDWEDMAIGPGPTPGESYLYAGDIGDNPSTRPNVKIYRAVEPKVDPNAAPTTTTLAGVETFTLSYPDGAHDAETLLVDPVTSDLFIVVKANGMSPVFRAKAPLSTGGPIVLDQVATLVFGSGALPGGTQTTAGDVSANGEWIAVRTYGSAFLWRRPTGSSVGEALAGPPCPIPLRFEPQGEALGFLVDGSGYVTVSEGVNQPLYRFTKQ